MSSSDEESRFGTIFMGPTPDRETTLERLYDAAQREVWNQQTEEEYLERVKARATERVRALLLQARRRGDDILREAESKAGSLRAEAAAIKAEAEQTRDALTGEARPFAMRPVPKATRKAGPGPKPNWPKPAGPWAKPRPSSCSAFMSNAPIFSRPGAPIWSPCCARRWKRERGWRWTGTGPPCWNSFWIAVCGLFWIVVV